MWPQWWLATTALTLLILTLAGRPAQARAAWLLPLLAATGAGCLGLWGELARVWLEARAGGWLLAAGFAAAVSMLAMVFDARYRSFPSAALLVPALVYLLRPVPTRRAEAALLAFIVGAGIAPQLYQEGLYNPQAWGWAAVSLLMTAALWRSLRTR